MADIGQRQPVWMIEVNGTPYRLVSEPNGSAPIWWEEPVQTQRGDPLKAQEFEWNDWSRGMGDSRGVFPGAVEKATAFLGRMGHILPPHAITTLATGHDLDMTAIVEVTAPANRIITFGGRYAKEIDPADLTTVATSVDFGAGKTGLDAVLFQDTVAVAMGESVAFKYRDNAGSYHDNTNTSDTIDGLAVDYRYANSFGIAGDGGLVRGRSKTWSKTNANITNYYTAANANWGTEYWIGNQAYNVRRVFSFNRWDYVLKPDGLYSFDVNNLAVQQVPDMARWPSVENNQWFVWGNRIFVCSIAGLFRNLQSGATRTVGPETWKLNESSFRNVYPTAGEAYGEWAYVAFYDSTANTTYITMGRAAQQGDAGSIDNNVLTLTSIIYSFTGKCRVMKVLSLTSSPTLAFGEGGSLSYFTLTREGTPASYKSSGTFTVDMSPTDFGNPTTMKYFRRVEVIGGNIGASQTVQFAAAMDGGSFNNVGSAIASASSRYATAFWTQATNDGGRTMQPRLTGGCNSASAPLDIRNILISYEERPLFVPGARFIVDFEDYAGNLEAVSRLTSLEQREAFKAYLDGAIVTVRDPFGETYPAAINTVDAGMSFFMRNTIKQDLQNPGEFPQESQAFVLRRLSYTT